MEIQKEQEIGRFCAAFKTVDESARGPYNAMFHAAAQILFASKNYSESSFAEKRQLLRQNAQTISNSDVEDDDVLRDLAIACAEVNLHARTSDDDWFEASVDLIFQLGRYCQSRSGLDAFLWHRELSVHVCLWTQGMLDRLYDGRGAYVERLLQERTDDGTHPTLAKLHCASNILHGLGQFFLSEQLQKQWVASGTGFYGRLLFTHAFSTGICMLEDADGLWPHLPAINGAIVSWPYPLVKDQDFTFALIEKMGAPHHLPQFCPGYFESEAWCERLLGGARAYLEGFQQAFCRGDARDPSNADAWKKMASALQVYSELVLVYDIDEYRKS